MIDFACKTFELDEIVKCALGLSKADYRILRFMIHECEQPFTSEMLAKRLGLNLSTVQRALKKLHEKDVIFRTQQNMEGGGYVFVYQPKDPKALRKKVVEIVHRWAKQVERNITKW